MSFDITQGAQALLRYINRHEPIGWEAQTLETTPGLRMVVQYALYDQVDQTDQAAARVPFLTPIGKFYAEATGAHTYQIMRELSACLAQQPTAVLATPQALFYDKRQRFLVQQRVDGTPFYDLLNLTDYAAYFRLAGQALAQLHTLQTEIGRPTQIADHLRELIRPHPSELGDRMPRYKAQIAALLDCFTKQEQGWCETLPLAPIHRDVHLRQLFYGHGHVWLIDWDGFAKGDPALDVGNFLVYLQTHLGMQRVAASRAFVAGYCEHQSSDVLTRVPLYMAFTYLRLACKRYRLKGERWEELVDAMLCRSEECLITQSYA